MNERVFIITLACLSILSIFFAPWATIHREIGAKGAVILLSNQTIDFTGNITPIEIPYQLLILAASLGALVIIILAAILKLATLTSKIRSGLWLLAGLALISITLYGWYGLHKSLEGYQLKALTQVAEQAIAKPRRSTDVEAVKVVLVNINTTPLDKSIASLKAAKVRVRNLPYSNASINLSAFLCLLVGIFAIILSFRLSNKLGYLLDQLIYKIAIPSTAILLALGAAAIVILALQPTPLGRGVEINTIHMYLVGRADTLWYAYETIFASSLGNLAGFLEALKFATPLIFTGLAVAFSFRAGLFNIGAPGQMVLGAIFAMLVGVYLPGPKLLVLPLAVFAAALGGGLWGALPGWLKARFGANEVINTILLNYIASSLLLFLLSASHTFAAPALRALIALLAIASTLLFLNLLPPIRRLVSKKSRRVNILVSIITLGIVLIIAIPRATDQPITFTLPFKAAGSEPKSLPISEAARFEHLSTLLSGDPAKNPNTNIIPPTQLNGAFLLAILAAIAVYYFLWRTKWGYELRAVGISPQAAKYGGANLARNTVLAMFISGALAGLTACHYVLGGALEEYSLRQSLPTSDGFDGIAVALLGYNTPLGVVLSAFLFGVLKNGGAVMNVTFPQLTRDVVNMILALVVLFIAARGFLPERLQSRN